MQERDLRRFIRRVRRLALDDALADIEELPATGYRLLVPPLESEAAAAVRVAELRSMGIDSYMIRGGENKFGISLGVYTRMPILEARRAYLVKRHRLEMLVSEIKGYSVSFAVRLRADRYDELDQREQSDLRGIVPNLQLEEVFCNLDVAS